MQQINNAIHHQQQQDSLSQLHRPRFTNNADAAINDYGHKQNIQCVANAKGGKHAEYLIKEVADGTHTFTSSLIQFLILIVTYFESQIKGYSRNFTEFRKYSHSFIPVNTPGLTRTVPRLSVPKNRWAQGAQ